MTLAPGTKLRQYEVVESIGVGGMGEVYRARDTKLGREVAIKVLPEALSKDRERLLRLEREAKLLAALNHPAIATLYGFEDDFLVMELVEGETLAERIARGPIPIDEARSLFMQIAEGLEAAREKGIIHRDLKPANIKITPDGKPKILDFGLAKAFSPAQDVSAETSQSPTLTKGTALGVIMGTASYMSPEQARGKAIDKRTDVWAFACCLFEALAGRTVFEGETVTDIIAAVVNREPEWQHLPATRPEKIRELLRRSLEKDRRERLRDIGDAWLDLRDAADAPAPKLQAGPRGRSLYVAAGGVALGALLVWSLWRVEPEPKMQVRFTVRLPAGASLAGPVVAVSPDGTTIAFTGRVELYLRRLNEIESRPVGFPGVPYAPFFSPDGEWIAANIATQAVLSKIRVDGGDSVTIGPTTRGFTSGSWGDGGTIVFSDSPGSLWKVSADGGAPERLKSPDPTQGESTYRWPAFLPGGKNLLFTIVTNEGQSNVAVLDFETAEHQIVLENGGRALYSPGGLLVYGTPESVHAAPFDLSRLLVVGESIPVLQNVLTNRAGGASFAVSEGGTLAYLPSDVLAGRILVWVDRDGNEEELGVEPSGYTHPRVSPDGRRIAFHDNEDIWIHDIEFGTTSRFTFDPARDRYPLWSVDGERVFFESWRTGTPQLFSKPADGTGTAERLDVRRNDESYLFRPYGFTPDGKTLAFIERSTAGGSWNIATLSLSEDSITAKPLLSQSFVDRWPTISPNGQFMAYATNELSDVDISVRTFPDIDAGRWQISDNRGNWPLWSPDGFELFYFSMERGTYMSVPIRYDPQFQAGTPRPLFGGPYPRQNGRHYDITPDGKRFLMVRDSTNIDSAEIHVVTNWLDELERLVPSGN